MRLDYYEGQFDARVSFTYSSVATADTVPPAAVTDLAATAANTTSVTLQWTAPGDDGMIGQATWYDFRYNTSGPITDSNFDDATHYELPFFPHSPGTVERATVSGLQTGVQYWFALRTADEVPNWSGVSNSPRATTKTGGTGAGGTGACDGCSSDSIWDFGYVGGIPGVLVAGLVLAVGVGGLASWRVAVRRRNHPSPRGRRAPSTR